MSLIPAINKPSLPTLDPGLISLVLPLIALFLTSLILVRPLRKALYSLTYLSPCRVLQQSVLDPLLFSLYRTPLSKTIDPHLDIKFHFYAAGTLLFIYLSDQNTSLVLAKLKIYLQDVKTWMSLNVLASKTRHQ